MPIVKLTPSSRLNNLKRPPYSPPFALAGFLQTCPTRRERPVGPVVGASDAAAAFREMAVASDWFVRTNDG